MTKPYYQSDRCTLYHGDSLAVLPTLEAVDSVVTDPPYGLSFMGKRWDYDVPGVDLWSACLDALKPGGHLLAFAGTRTQHRMAVNIEDAGFDIRDMIAWVYGSGFPKSLDVSKAIDKAAGAEREMVRVAPRAATCGTMAGASDTRPWIEKSREVGYHEVAGNKPVTAEAFVWKGWGTALKPAMEPVTVARKPLDGTVADNVLRHGTGAINVDGCRVAIPDGDGWDVPAPDTKRINPARSSDANGTPSCGRHPSMRHTPSSGRWPANLIHDGSDEVVEPLGEASRYFYCSKASKADRDEGCEGLDARQYSHDGRGVAIENAYQRNNSKARNHHPTVKPTDLMRYLCRLVTPPGGVVLDPFCGSGSTGKAAMLEGFRFIGIEREEAYCEIAAKRIQAAERDNAERLVVA